MELLGVGGVRGRRRLRGRRRRVMLVLSASGSRGHRRAGGERRELGQGKVRRGPVAWGGASFDRFRPDAVDLLQRRWHVLTAGDARGQPHRLRRARRLAAGVRRPVVRGDARGGVRRVVVHPHLGTIPITPGGIGIVEVGLTSALIGFGGNNAGVVAAVLVYRFLTIVPTLLVGLVSAATWRRRGLQEPEPVQADAPLPPITPSG